MPPKGARLEFCIRHKDLTLEERKKVIWTDETSVVLGARRGSIRLWRKSDATFEESVIRNRWKGFSEFMFWGSFSWYQKGPCHIWRAETAKERRESELEIDQLNALNEPEKMAEWELTQPFSRLTLRPRKGKKPQWRFTHATGKLARKGKGGIDWYRYQKEIVKKKVIPFAQEHEKEYPGTLVQEDNAPAHAHWFIEKVYNAHGIQRLLWPGNSPDLNVIEKVWSWLKKTTTRT